MIKVVFFDFGGVLIDNVLNTYTQQLRDLFGIDEKIAEKYWCEHEHAYYAGRTDATVFYKHFAEHIDLLTTPEELERIYTGCIIRKEESWQIVQELRNRITLSVISDMAPAATRHIREHYDMSLFEHPLFSSEIGITKQDVNIFRVALQNLGITGEQALFIDDSIENISNAETVGITGIVFDTTEQLKARLSELGIIS